MSTPHATSCLFFFVFFFVFCTPLEVHVAPSTLLTPLHGQSSASTTRLLLFPTKICQHVPFDYMLSQFFGTAATCSANIFLTSQFNIALQSTGL